ncbi:hypothetical protein BJV77DRAFT_297796 [Russula vinacea]|jgi:hypothetical protein|nr:hypothetical protein BJV77DRAFT_297796 [Russula vinacea]
MNVCPGKAAPTWPFYLLPLLDIFTTLYGLRGAAICRLAATLNLYGRRKTRRGVIDSVSHFRPSDVLDLTPTLYPTFQAAFNLLAHALYPGVLHTKYRIGKPFAN